jgi:hypothetical protein
MSQSKHSRRIVPITRSQIAFAVGLRGGLFSTPSPIEQALGMVSCCAVGCAMHLTATYDGAMTVTVENDTFTKSDNNYTNGLCHRDDLARPARGVRVPPRDFRRVPRL